MHSSYIKKLYLFALTVLLSFNAKSQALHSHQSEDKFVSNTHQRSIPFFARVSSENLSDSNSKPVKIIYFGSSVPYGHGATNFKGYTSLFSDILKNRTSPFGTIFETVNISRAGDNTIGVLNRYNKDLLPQKGKYVIFALALGNEGIHEHGQPMFEQFERNIKRLIEKARADGYIPILTNSYTRNDYNAQDYAFIKKMNLLIHQMDVPSINLLGAVDNLSGKWMDGFWADGAHPNDAGHAEMALTIVPSLFDALEQQKPMPKSTKGSSIKLSKNRSKSITIAFTPEQKIHPFTTTISFKTGKQGTILQINDSTGNGKVSVSKDGKLVYSSSKSGIITGSSKVDDNKWHKISVTHYYAKGITMLYCDSTLQGTVNEKLITTGVNIGGSEIPKKISFKNWLFYRSAMNREEIKYLVKDSLLQSSLELYAPLDQKKKSYSNPLINLAQSLNTIQKITIKRPTVSSKNK
ncbi:GDSL-type esterase/lipase family protein [Pedobacter sp.]|uniref:GDSL-type esterase/lipase family protein n=1 Tax=Pedobacter sp. TaxID=1411316 RepID=UPI003D7FB5E9